MKFAISTLTLAALSLVGFVAAVDDRLLYEIPADDTIDSFESSFDSTCENWTPALEQGLTFTDIIFEPGDYQGNNADTEVKIVCLWQDPTTGAYETFTSQVADSLGATAVSGV